MKSVVPLALKIFTFLPRIEIRGYEFGRASGTVNFMHIWFPGLKSGAMISVVPLALKIFRTFGSPD